LRISKATVKRIAILSIDELLVLAFLIWGLPALGIHLPLGAIIGITAGLITKSVVTYRLAKPALVSKPRVGLDDMSGTRGKVLEPIDPEGLIIVAGEVWKARHNDGSSPGGQQVGSEVIVVRREGLTLTVRNCEE
jgi:membrane protein implicated in regulation of membrane protease activity